MSGVLFLAAQPAVATGDGAGVTNLVTDDPREAWVAPNGAPVTFQLDFGGVAAIDTVYLGYATLTRPARFEATLDGAAIGGAGFVFPRLAGRPAHALLALAQPVAGQRLVVSLTIDPADRPLRLGVAMAGLSFRPVWPQEWGGGRPVIDCGTRDRLAGGGFAIDRGARKSGWQWTLGDLSDDELATLFALAWDRGETAPLLVVEDSDPARPGLCERIHYGVFDKLQPYERRDTGLTRWALTFEDWL